MPPSASPPPGGHSLAQVETARMLLHGIGGGADTEPALEWLLRSERLGHSRTKSQWVIRAVLADCAPALLAAAVHFGRREQPQDQALCLQLLQRAAESGSATAAILLSPDRRQPTTAATLLYPGSAGWGANSATGPHQQ